MLFFILYKIGIFLALLFPVKTGYKLAFFVSRIKHVFSFKEKREILGNLRVVLPDADLKTLRRYSRDIFVNFSKYLVDFFRFENLDVDYINNHVELVNRHYVDDALKAGKGAIILSAHLGNWELGGVAMGILGYKMNAVALGHKNKLINDFFVNQRQRKNEHVIPISVALKQCFKVLRGNEVLAILGDRDFTNTGVAVKFFGKETVLPKRPAVFSLKTGAAIVPAFTIRAHDDKFELIYDKPIEYSPTGDFDKDVVNLVGLYAKVLEDYIKRYPTQWYCFRRFWQ